MRDPHVLVLRRFVPGVDTEPRWQEVPLPPDLDGSLLDALSHIKAHVDPTLSYRWSCRMGVCGSCGMMVDGEPRLACEVFVRDLPRGRIRVAPLEHFPILRDLIVDQERFITALNAITPWIVPADRPTGALGETLMSPAESAAIHDTSQCINCLLCYAACPQVALTPSFLGPAALALAHRYELDARDEGDRGDALQAMSGVWSCTLVGACTTVCPKEVDPASAIQQQKVRGLLSWLADRVGWRR